MRKTELQPNRDKNATTLRKNATNHDRHVPITLGHLVEEGDKISANLRLFSPLEEGKAGAVWLLRRRPAVYHGATRIMI